MAFAKKNTVAAVSSSNESWKAAGFINFYLPGVSGKDKKLGAISLRDTKPAEKELNAWLAADTANVGKVASQLVVEYNSAEASNQDQFDLGIDAPAPVPAGEKAGYLNFYLPAKDGTRRKLGFIALKESDPERAPMLAWLDKEPGNIATVASKLIVKYQSATSTAHGFALV